MNNEHGAFYLGGAVNVWECIDEGKGDVEALEGDANGGCDRGNEDETADGAGDGAIHGGATANAATKHENILRGHFASVGEIGVDGEDIGADGLLGWLGAFASMFRKCG